MTLTWIFPGTVFLGATATVLGYRWNLKPRVGERPFSLKPRTWWLGGLSVALLLLSPVFFSLSPLFLVFSPLVLPFPPLLLWMAFESFLAGLDPSAEPLSERTVRQLSRANLVMTIVVICGLVFIAPALVGDKMSWFWDLFFGDPETSGKRYPPNHLYAAAWPPLWSRGAHRSSLHRVERPGCGLFSADFTVSPVAPPQRSGLARVGPGHQPAHRDRDTPLRGVPVTDDPGSHAAEHRTVLIPLERGSFTGFS